MKKRIAMGVVALAAAGMLQAQAPQPADREVVSAMVAGKKVSVDYGRPALKGRALDELLKQLPEDRIWRAGENEVTILSTEGPLMVGDKKVPAGHYSVYVHIPTTGDWSLVLNSDPGIALIKIWPKAPPATANHMWPRLDGYKNIADKEVARVAMKAGAPGAPVDVFTTQLAQSKDGATLTMSWANKVYSVDLKAAK